MGEGLYDRHGAARRYLPGDHQLEPIARERRDGGHHAQRILNGISVAKTIAFARIDEARRPRPRKVISNCRRSRR